jgi:hypothetical protein
MMFNPGDLTAMNANFKGNANLGSITMRYFFIRVKTCPAGNSFVNSTTVGTTTTITLNCVPSCTSPQSSNSITNYC